MGHGKVVKSDGQHRAAGHGGRSQDRRVSTPVRTRDVGEGEGCNVAPLERQPKRRQKPVSPMFFSRAKTTGYGCRRTSCEDAVVQVAAKAPGSASESCRRKLLGVVSRWSPANAVA